MPQFSTKLHPLAPDVKCPTCGRTGLTFVRVRIFGDLYECASGGPCECRVVHYWNKTTKRCGYSVIYGLGRLEKWTECVERPAAAKAE